MAGLRPAYTYKIRFLTGSGTQHKYNINYPSGKTGSDTLTVKTEVILDNRQQIFQINVAG